MGSPSQDLRYSEGGPSLVPNLILPPNLQTAMERSGQAVIKLELSVDGEFVAPEKVDLSRGYRFSDASARILGMLVLWCGRWPGSILQLSAERLEALMELAGQETVFRLHGQPDPLPKESEILEWIAERAKARQSEAADQNRQREKTAAGPSPKRNPSKSGGESRTFTPGTIDGSSHFLAIQLPSTEHPAYEEIRERVKADRFKLEPSNRKWWLRDRQRVLEFLAEYGEKIETSWGLKPTANFRERTAMIRPLAPEISVEPVAKEEDGFSVSVDWKGTSEEVVEEAIRQGSSYVESGQKIYLLSRNQVERVRRLKERAQSVHGVSGQGPAGGDRFRVNKEALSSVDELLHELDPQWTSPEAWKESVRRLKDPDAVEIPELPSSFISRLRGYQKVGVGWLWNLHRNGLGGLLADEMGLGKTIQSLGLIGALGKGTLEGKPALVVCPASLVENWVREAEEFLPGIRAHPYQGAGRDLDFSRLGAGDLVVTSYGTLRADRALFLKTDFSTVVADEAQNFKNPATETARVMRSLQTESRFALTGTPIENSITDLVGIGRFALPAVFGGRRADRSMDPETTLARTRPYLLRRTKAEVLTDLPEKWESRRFVGLTDEQQKLYQEIRVKTEQRLFSMKSSGVSAGRMTAEIWTELLRLRQITAEPRIIDSELPREASGKAAGLMEILSEAVDGGSRLLVFSQFTETLKWLRKDLEEDGIPYCYLDGSTKDRQARVDRFNNDSSIPVFLLSLKAGGTGLNLTGADTVVHYDPWWNPAAEAQATDRAHRIGQTRKVQSIKLIGAGTVEEKVLRLQDEKRALLGSLFDEKGDKNGVMDWETLEELFLPDRSEEGRVESGSGDR